jgi:hypothetical protein
MGRQAAAAIDRKRAPDHVSTAEMSVPCAIEGSAQIDPAAQVAPLGLPLLFRPSPHAAGTARACILNI